MRPLNWRSSSECRQLQRDTEGNSTSVWHGPWWSSSYAFALLLGLSAFVKGLLNGQYNYRKVKLCLLHKPSKHMVRCTIQLFSDSSDHLAGLDHMPAALERHMHVAPEAAFGAIICES
jgi:hypothetical protein